MGEIGAENGSSDFDKSMSLEKVMPSESGIPDIAGDPSEIEAIVKAQVFNGFAATGRTSAGDPPTLNAGNSKQIPDTYASFGQRALAPPYSPLLWAQLLEKSTRLSSCIAAMAQNTVGLGWRVVPKKDVDSQTPQSLRDAIAAETELVETLFNFPNDDMPFSEVMTLVKTDEEATGNGYLEVIRDMAGRPARLYHVPSHTLRVDRLGGYVQKRSGKVRFFKSFNDERDKNAYTGDFHPGGTLSQSLSANEIIHFRLYTSRDSYYGIPRIVCAAPAVTGNRLAGVRNAAFFENDAVPRMAVLISGGHLAEGSAKTIKEFLQSDAKGPSNAHRILVIEAEGKKVSLNKQEPIKISLEKLTVGETDDASFQEYRKLNDEEIREAFRIGAIFLGTTEHENRASATIERRITIEQVFKPEQLKKEYTINHKILRAMGVKHVAFEFLRPKSDDPIETAPADAIHGRMGALTPNDVRRERGLKPYPATCDWGDVPFELTRLKYQGLYSGKNVSDQPPLESGADPEEQVEGESAEQPPESGAEPDASEASDSDEAKPGYI